MRYGFWLPVFGGWLRNIDDEHMPAAWDSVLGFDPFAKPVD
jgi:FMNH2-dependent dimethyl sulfone monooxygenase